MDWDKAIERNRLPLVDIVSALFVLLVSARLAGVGLMVPRFVWRQVMFVLRPAEAAVRRLIIIAARTLVLGPLKPRGPVSPSSFPAIPKGPVPLAPAFNLFDALKTFNFNDDNGGLGSAGFSASAADIDSAPVNAAGLHLRLRALSQALADLSKQARRLARFNARRKANTGKFMRFSPMRPGLPPGWRDRPKHEVDPLLRECHRLAHYLADTQYRPDTS